MGKKINELGNKYGTMVVIREVPKEERPIKNAAYWELQCELCGERRIIRGVNLRRRGIVCDCQKAKINELGNKYGTMVVIREVPKEEKTDKSHNCYWELQCEICGEKRIMTGSNLRNHGIRCKCQNAPQMKNLIGQTFGRLTVVRMATKEERNGSNYSACWCKCSCGNSKLKLVRSCNLENGNVKSCGCLKSHGEELINQILTNNNIDFQKEYFLMIY